MLRSLNGYVERMLLAGLALGFAGLIATVSAQVIARNVLEIPLIWTLDVAQLLFAWCIFIGAAVALRRGGHYALDLFPADQVTLRRAVGLISFAASVIVVFVLIRYGAVLATMGWRQESAAIGISGSWFFAPIPLSGVFMALFLAEHAVDLMRGGVRT